MQRRTFVAAGLALTAGAQALAQTRTVTSPGASGNAPRALNVALVLGSGSARGFAHIGVIKALEAARIKPNLIVGTSAGALVGSFFAAGFSAAQMEDVALKVRDIEIVDFHDGAKRGMVIGDSLQKFVNGALRGRTIEQLPTPFMAVATRMKDGEPVTFTRGDVGAAVRASCSVPGVFLPTKIADVEYIDGGLVSPVPVRAAREAGANVVIAVDVGSAVINNTPVGVYEQVMHAFDIMSRSLARIESAQADILIQPDLARIPSTDFNARAAFIAMGYSAGQRFVPVIQERMSGLNTRPARKQ